MSAPVKFIADSMLGKLAKWLRIMGYDTHYRRHYGVGEMGTLIIEGRELLTKNRKAKKRYSPSRLIRSSHVKDQLRELKREGIFTLGKGKRFSRCIICNVELSQADIKSARENVPEYVFYQCMTHIRFCQLCGRYFWPGSHRDSMIQRLEEWGI